MVEKFELNYYNQGKVWSRYQNSREVNRAKRIIKLIPDDAKTVLDIGCGNGIVTNMIKKPIVVGLDFARTPLSYINVNAIQASIDALPLKNLKFNLVIMTEVLEHLDDKTYPKAIQEIKNLSPDYFLITVPYKEPIDDGLGKCVFCGNLFNLSYHFRVFNDDWFKKEFKEYDLEKIEYCDNFIPPNDLINKLRHKSDIYAYSDRAICNKCGNRPIRSSLTLKSFIFNGMYLLDFHIKKLLIIRKPYHQMILLKRIKN